MHGENSALCFAFSVLLLCLCGTSVEGELIRDLFDPSISLWDTIQSDAALESFNAGFDGYNGYVGAFGDFDSDKQYVITILIIEISF